MKTALHHLAELDLESRRAAHPDVPAFAITRRKFSDATANDLTKSIVRCFELHNHFSTRLASTGTYRADLKKFVPSQQRSGLPDVFAIIKPSGRAVFTEIKVGRDTLSEVQKETIAALERAGATVFIATDFASFWQWFHSTFTPFDEADALPFGPVERESTPEDPTLF